MVECWHIEQVGLGSQKFSKALINQNNSCMVCVQTAPAAMVRDGRGLQLGSIEEGVPTASVEQAHSPTMYKTLSDPAPLGRTLSFDK